MSNDRQLEELGRGGWLRLVRDGRWEFTERVRSTGVAIVVPVTDAREIVLVEQYRPAVERRVVELPAGLVGDEPHLEGEGMEEATRRELFEETGYEAKSIEWLSEGPPSAGVSSEIVTLLLATGLQKTGQGGGDEHEDIEVHVVPLDEAAAWLKQRERDGRYLDPKVWSGLWFASTVEL